MAVAPEIVKEVMDANTVTTIINNLNSLYSGALSQVITYTAIIIGVVGIIIPALSVLFQWRSLKVEKEGLEKAIQEGINNAKASIRADLIQEMKEQISIEEKKLIAQMDSGLAKYDKRIECSTASVFFLQGKSHLSANQHTDALKDFCVAAKRFLNGHDFLNGQRALKMAIEECLPKINNVEYDETVEKYVSSLLKLLESEHINSNGQFHDLITALKEEIKKAKLREPAKTNQ